jgi:hypothetical protein
VQWQQLGQRQRQPSGNGSGSGSGSVSGSGRSSGIGSGRYRCSGSGSDSGSGSGRGSGSSSGSSSSSGSGSSGSGSGSRSRSGSRSGNGCGKQWRQLWHQWQQWHGKELEVLLCWKGVPVSKMGNVANRRVPYQQFADGGGEEEDDAWTDADKVGLVALKNVHIEMADNSYGWFLAAQKRDAERAFQHMDATDREAFMRRLTEIDAADTEDGQSPPPNPTPV